MIYSFKEYIPVIHPSAFVHPLAAVTGNVEIGKDVYIGPGAAVRGDFGRILISDGCNVQENCVLHTFPGGEVVLKPNAHIGHGAIIHGSHIGENCLIGMNAVIMDHVILEAECIVGALSFVKANSVFQERSLIVGNPAQMIKKVSDEMMGWKTEGTQVYHQLARDMHIHWKEAKPLTENVNRRKQEGGYSPWNNSNNI